MNRPSRFSDRVDPALRDGLALYETLGLTQNQQLTTDVIIALRAQGNAAVSAFLADVPHDERVARHDHVIQGPTGEDLPVRVYQPRSSTGALPAFMWLHGGGMISGGIDADRPVCERYALDLDCTVVSVDYRLAPEDPYPAGVEDCYAALVWTAQHADELGIDTTRVAVGGESAGAGLAAATALLARDRKSPELVFQALTYPMLDDRNNTPSASEFHAIPSWSRQHNDGAWRAVLGMKAGGPDVEPYAAPARADDLSALPPTLIQVGELDVFRDEDITYATRLLQAGVPTELHVYPGAYHGWDAVAPQAPSSVQMRDERTAALRQALQG
ncbi:alpha/beta hydrolase fold domain-containing protein [Streptomyces sp. SID8382]|uniref:alpha/beta hydrolase n=1 Tax=Streptomyces malaysiensis TaxID=92644 RepID=UPI000C2CB0D9|nr:MULTISPECIES: alpha/beta hydrolase [unclassified Streptomyces]AUA07942.1 Carboxylesterase NlhH [Streptomyces sp. M56]MYX62500.1 alpha/beta hydrolase fold domain-containing protein [Streptomyces sp. SID8382]